MKSPDPYLWIVLSAVLLVLPALAPAQAMKDPVAAPAGVDSGFRYEEQKRQASSLSDQTHPGKIFMMVLLKFYQAVFSSQDGSTCQFRPSCSHYAVSAAKRFGPVEGFLMAGDRLIRCNPYTRGQYPFYPDYQHLEDPVEDHALW